MSEANTTKNSGIADSVVSPKRKVAGLESNVNTKEIASDKIIVRIIDNINYYISAFIIGNGNTSLQQINYFISGI